MKIAIDNQIKIAYLQQEFNKLFPFLKIEFFLKQHKTGEGSEKKIMVPNTKTLGEIKIVKKAEEIDITPDMTVCELEQQFNTKYGLSVQVFRKSGRSWLETTVTDNWTLMKQDQEGKELSSLG